MKNKILISILIVFLFVSLCGGDNTLTFSEKNLSPRQIITYPDNTVVFRLVERFNDTCNVPNLTFRILYPNGTYNLITVHDHPIPSSCFCGEIRQNKPPVIDQISFKDTITNYILVGYSDTINVFGMVIDWSGVITR